jgi:hypothetical protein
MIIDCDGHIRELVGEDPVLMVAPMPDSAPRDAGRERGPGVQPVLNPMPRLEETS